MQELDPNQLTLTQMDKARSIVVSDAEVDELLGSQFTPGNTMPPPPPRARPVYCGGFEPPVKAPRIDLVEYTVPQETAAPL